MPQKECGKRSSITFFRFRDAFGHFSVTFLTLLSLFSSLFCQTPFVGLLLRQGESHFSASFKSLWGRSARVALESFLGHFISLRVSRKLGAH